MADIPEEEVASAEGGVAVEVGVANIPEEEAASAEGGVAVEVDVADIPEEEVGVAVEVGVANIPEEETASAEGGVAVEVGVANIPKEEATSAGGMAEQIVKAAVAYFPLGPEDEALAPEVGVAMQGGVAEVGAMAEVADISEEEAEVGVAMQGCVAEQVGAMAEVADISEEEAERDVAEVHGASAPAEEAIVVREGAADVITKVNAARAPDGVVSEIEIPEGGVATGGGVAGTFNEETTHGGERPDVGITREVLPESGDIDLLSPGCSEEERGCLGDGGEEDVGYEPSDISGMEEACGSSVGEGGSEDGGVEGDEYELTMVVSHVKEPWMEAQGNLVAHIKVGPSYHLRKEVRVGWGGGGGGLERV